MNSVPFRAWLDEKFDISVAASRFANAKKVEEKYGDFDEHFEKDGFDKLIAVLSYTKADERDGKINPTKISINGNIYAGLATLKSAVSLYRRFRDQDGATEIVTEALIEKAAEFSIANKEGKRFEVERHLQAALRLDIDQLESGLKIIDGGMEISVASGSIDILAEDSEGCAVVIELKAGTAKREAIGQITGYMGDLVEDEKFESVRGILVAADFDKAARAAIRVIPSLTLRQYRFSFSFENLA